MAITALTDQSLMNFQLNAGAFFEGLDMEAITDIASLKSAIETAMTAGKCLGATDGGGTFVCTPEVRNITADGMRAKIKGATVFDSWDVKLTTTLKEVTASTMATSLATSETDLTVPGLAKITVNTMLTKDDYIDKLTWVGDRADGSIIAITIYGALNISGFTLTFADKAEGKIPVEFVAHNDNLANIDKIPAEIIIFSEVVAPA